MSFNSIQIELNYWRNFCVQLNCSLDACDIFIRIRHVQQHRAYILNRTSIF